MGTKRVCVAASLPPLFILAFSLIQVTAPLCADKVNFTIVGKAQPITGQPDKWRICASKILYAVIPSDTRKLAGIAKLDGDGSFELAVTAAPGELLFLCAHFNGVLSCSSITQIKAPDKDGVRIELGKMHLDRVRDVVEFAIETPDGKRLGRKALVHIYNMYGEVTAKANGLWSDDNGVVRIEGLLSGLYDVWVEDVEGDKEGKFARMLFRCVEVAAGENAQRIELRLQPSGAICGRLLFSDGKPASGCIVSMQTATFPSERTQAASAKAAYAHGAIDCYAEAVVQGDGSFALVGLTAGIHSLDVRVKGELRPKHTINDVAVKPGQTTDIGAVVLPDEGWQFMFDGQTLTGWKESDFFGRNEVRIENDRIVMLMGNDMTGITWVGELPRIDYEVTLQGMRVSGSDFFCGLTFPVGDSHCSLILGGWGGGVVGISCIDGFDASQNETTRFMQFQNGRWYRIRLRVTNRKIEAWLDSQKIVDVIIEGKRLSIRWECEPSIPFGIATWRTTGAVRDIRIRKL
ncbi:MAG: DUF1080 domain-containing protein [Armatimonadota bacterium]|nr:DUF1080 domain-containing protein [Armatimonadota bacterium]MDW8025921.1 DUF1080 domain-containing protein [Armatimonadota bacterium]